MMDYAPSLTMELNMRLQEVASSDTPANLWQVRGDEELAEFHHESRTSPTNGAGKFPCTPSVFRFFPTAREDAGDFRVNVLPLQSAFLALNGEDSMEDPKARYFTLPTTGLYNNSGYPHQAYVTTSRNYLAGEVIGNWLRFVTLTPHSDVAGMTFDTHPHYVHRFDLVCWDRLPDGTYTTKHKWTTPQGIIDYYLCTDEGFAFIPLRYVRKV